MNDQSGTPVTNPTMWAPLRIARFRTIWIASCLSNLGLLVQGVGASWAMTEETPDATLVAMVQTATMLPMLLFTLPAGAMADMYERRHVAIAALLISLAGILTLLGLSLAEAINPAGLLALSFVAGCGMAFFWPAWQSAVADDVPAAMLPAGVGLNSISYNSARVLGPAVGGVIVAAGGAVVAFAASALLYLPMLVAQLRPGALREPPRLPPERLGRAVISGLRYVLHSPKIRIIISRSFAIGAVGGSVHVLMPLISRDLLDSDADVFGFLLGSFGLGAIIGVFLSRQQRSRFGAEGSMRLSTIILGIAFAAVAISRSAPLTAAALVVAGAAWMTMTQACNVSLQMLVPRWVAGRAVACFQASLSGGIAAAGLSWGLVAEHWGVDVALLASGAFLFLSMLFGLISPMPEVGESYVASGESLPAPEVALAVTGRSGPIIVEIEYRVPVDQARSFYRLVQAVQRTRMRNGAYGLSLARDLGDLELWVERYHFPTWHDYLRQRDRMTPEERHLQQKAVEFHAGDEPLRVKRLLERPFGSVRWSEESPDPGGDSALPFH